MPGEITCRRCGQRKAAQERAPVPGRWGPVVLEQTCAACWQDWVEEQTRVMNHERLLPSEPAHRAILYERMKTFLNLDV
jgi:Fe-S cluster biosynthesis and repair protein YggX